MTGTASASATSSTSAAQLIDERIASLGDWRGEVLGRVRRLILATDPAMVEEWKWRTAVWDHAGLVCGAGVFKDHVRLSFFHGATLEDPDGLFNSGLDAKASRAIDVRRGDELDEAAITALVRAAVDSNVSAAGLS